MSTIDTGGPAFPRPASQSTVMGEAGNAGQTLLDHFAGIAMGQMCAGPGARMVADRDTRYREGAAGNWAEVVALNAYEIADAMIAEKRRREQK